MRDTSTEKPAMPPLFAFDLKGWIERHRHLLQPPVCNQQIFEDSGFIVMIVGGPNSRDDYHYDEGEEFFYQIEGSMLLRTMQNDQRVDVTINEGQILLLPARVPHSPQRFENTVGLVIERQRATHELDGFMWFCDECDHLLYEEYLHIDDIVNQLPPVFDRFYNNPAHLTCDRCGHKKATNGD
ncbi:MAG: 3-hydroxyanthranilate 3,4-dioxygenase [Woeseiaceae bacterium]